MLRFTLAFALAAPVFAQRGEATARFENYYSFRHPVAWSYSAGKDNGMLFPPSVSASDDDERGEIMVMFTYTAELRDARSSSEVARISGALPPILKKRALGPAPFNAVEGSGWVHGWEVLDDGEVASVIRIYALPLRPGGAALEISTGGLQAAQTWRGHIDRIVATVSSQLPAETSRTASPAARPAAALAPAAPGVAPAASTTPARATAVPPAPVLSAEAAARLVAEWHGRLGGQTWTAPRKTYRLHTAGEFEYESLTVIAGLDDSAARKTADKGVWRIIVDGARPHLELESAAGRKWRVRCELRDAAVLLDGDPVQPAARVP